MRNVSATGLDFIKVVQANPHPPCPGQGHTLQRWRILASVAAQDLSVCKLAEAHWDALAILNDLEQTAYESSDKLWAVWAADNPKAPLNLVLRNGKAYLEGRKTWCSGADVVTHALLTCPGENADSYFCLLDMQAPGIHADHSQWQPVGMRSVQTAQLHFARTPVQVLGPRSLYLERPGFFHGGAGIAACWYGAACAIAQKLRTHLDISNPHASAHLGAMFAELRAVRSMFHVLAESIDREPAQRWVEDILALRSMMRNIATSVIEHSSRAMGPAPLCSDAEHAQRCADLAVWITQQHAERDNEGLGKLSQDSNISWDL